MKFINNKGFYKGVLRRYGGMIIPANTQTSWGTISYPMKFIGINLLGNFLFEYRNGTSIIPRGINVYIPKYKPKENPRERGINFLALSAHQNGLDFLEKIYQSQKTIHHEEILSNTIHL